MMPATSHLAHANHCLCQYICVRCVWMCSNLFIAFILKYTTSIFVKSAFVFTLLWDTGLQSRMVSSDATEKMNWWDRREWDTEGRKKEAEKGVKRKSCGANKLSLTGRYMRLRTHPVSLCISCTSDINRLWLYYQLLILFFWDTVSNAGMEK